MPYLVGGANDVGRVVFGPLQSGAAIARAAKLQQAAIAA